MVSDVLYSVYTYNLYNKQAFQMPLGIILVNDLNTLLFEYYKKTIEFNKDTPLMMINLELSKLFEGKSIMIKPSISFKKMISSFRIEFENSNDYSSNFYTYIKWDENNEHFVFVNDLKDKKIYKSFEESEEDIKKFITQNIKKWLCVRYTKFVK